MQARAVQELLGHKSVETTMIYTHVMAKPGIGVRSPLDALWMHYNSHARMLRYWTLISRLGWTWMVTFFTWFYLMVTAGNGSSRRG